LSIELWFPTKKITPLEATQFKDDSSDSSMPQKPRKLTPLFSRKRSEITQVKPIEPENEPVQREEPKLFEKEKSKVSLNDANIEEKQDVESIKSNDKVKPSLISPLANNEFKRPKPKSKLAANKKDQIRPASITEQIFKPNPNDSIVSEDFDNIWSSNTLMPQIEDNGKNLPTIGEEFRNTQHKNKSVLGGKIAKINDEEIQKMNMNINKDLEELQRIASSKPGSTDQLKHNDIHSDDPEKGKDKKLKAKKFTRSANKREKSDDNIILVDEYKSSSSLFADKSSSQYSIDKSKSFSLTDLDN
jgi:hypothetical protein